MGFLNNMRITLKLPAIMLTLIVLAVSISAIFAARTEERALTAAALDKMSAVLASDSYTLERYFGDNSLQLRRAANETTTLRGIRGMSSAWQDAPGDISAELRRHYIEENPFPAGERQNLEKAEDKSKYSAIHALIHKNFVSLMSDYGYYDIFLFDTEGNLLYTVAKEDDFATNMFNGPLSDSGLARAYRGAMEAGEGEQVFSDYELYAPSGGLPAAFIAQPVFMDGTRVGVVAFQLSDSRMTEVVSDNVWLGETAETFLVGPDFLLRTDRQESGESSVLSERLESEGVRAALAGENGERLTVNTEGVPVLRAYHPVDVFGTRWAAIADVAQSEALAGVHDLKRTLLWGSLAIVALCAVVAILFSASLARPLVRVTGAIGRISDGSLDTEVPDSGRGDEIGQIAHRLEDFREKLAEAEQERVQSTFRGAAFSASTAATVMLSPEGRIDHANASAVALFAEKAEAFRSGNPAFGGGEILGRDVAAVLPEDAVARIRSMIAQDSLPANIPLALGDTRLELAVGAVRTADGQTIGHVIELKDVTATFLGEAVMQSIDEYQLRADFVLGGGVIEVNAAFAQALGCDRAALGGRDVKEFLAAEAGPEQTAEVVSRLREGKPYSGRYRLTGPTGAEAIAEGSITPVIDNDGTLLRYILIANDVTEARRAIVVAERERQAAAAAQAAVVENLRAGLGQLAEGDLTTRIETPFTGDYDQLRSDFNTAVARLSEALAGVAANAEQISGGAAEISSAADDMSTRTERQAATLEETAAALDQLTASVKSAAEGAAEANRIVEAASGNAETSGEVVQEAVGAMGEIAESSKQISRITEVIDDIAYQTNLLALNAGVEAARAGEAGRGFAVVASEVRALAQRSSDAAREINDLISSSGRQVKRGVDLVGQAGEALTKIAEGVIDISRHVSRIAESSREQSTGLAEINEAVGQLDQVTQQNAAMFEEATAAGHSLTREAEILTRSMARFRTGGAVTPLHPAAPASAGTPARKTASNRSLPAQTAGAAGKAAPGPSAGPGAGFKSSARGAAKPAAARQAVPAVAGATALAEPQEDFEDEDGWSHF